LGSTIPAASAETFNLGATEPVDFADLLPRMAAITGLPVVTVDLPGAGVYYHTSNRLIRDRLGFTNRNGRSTECSTRPPAQDGTGRHREGA
jgi:hypothetical protein